MHKKDVPTAAQPLLDAMEQQPYLNSDFNVYSVSAHLFGKPGITVSAGVGTGSECGLWRVVPSGYSASSPATVPPHSTALKTTGLSKYQRSELTMAGSSILSTMRPIFIRTGVS